MASFIVNLAESVSIGSSALSERQGPNLGTAPKQVKALLLNSPEDRMGVSVSFRPLAVDAASYHIYRSGAFVLANPVSAILGITTGDTLEIIIRGGRKQTITFGAPHITSGSVTPDQVVANINAQLQGAYASLTYSTTSVIIRPNDPKGKGCKIQVTGGSANTFLQFPTEEFSVNTEISASHIIKTLTDPENEYIDRDGITQDSYYIVAESATGLLGQQSITKSLELYVDEVPNRTVIYGTIIRSDGKPAKNISVTLKPNESVIPALSDTNFSSSRFGISREEATVFTDLDGYFEVEAVVGSILNLVIPDIKYNYTVRIPPETIVFTDLAIAQENLNTNIGNSFFFDPTFAGGGSGSTTLGNVHVTNEDNQPIPVKTVDGIPFNVGGTVNIGNFPPGSLDPATETTLFNLFSLFDGTNDLGDVTVLNGSGNPVSVTWASALPISGTVAISNFPATQDVDIISSVPLTTSITGGTITANIGTTGGLALESTLSALNAKFVPGNELGEIKVTNGPGAAAVNIQDGGNSITVDGGVSVLNEPSVNLQDGAGTNITSTTVGPKQALDVFFAGGSISVALDHSTDDVLVYGWDGSANQKIKTDGNGELQIDVLSSALPVGASTEATLYAINVKIPTTPSLEHVLATSPHAARLTDGTTFYKATTPSDIQPISISLTGNDVDATIVNEPFFKIKDGLGTAITSTTVGPKQALDVNFPQDVVDKWFFADQTTVIMAVSPLNSDYSFSFTSVGFALFNDEDPLTSGNTDVEYSWDNFTTVHGKVKAGEAVVFDNINQTLISLRSVGSTRSYRLKAWGV